jgi:hypothetical protein
MNSLTENYLGYLDIVNLNEQQLKEHMSTIIIESKVTVSKMETSYKNNINVVEKYLKKYKVDIGFIKSSAKKASQFISNQHKKGIPAKQTSKDMVQTIGKKTLSKVMAKVKSSSVALDLDLSDKVIRSLGIFAIMLFMSTLLFGLANTIIVPLFGAKMAVAFGAVVIAPFIEEYAKRFALIKGHPFIYTGIFGGIEALLYIIAITSSGGTLATALSLRAAALAMHFSTTFIQKLYHDKGKEDNDESKSLTGYYVAVGVHSLWNFLTVKNMF